MSRRVASGAALAAAGVASAAMLLTADTAETALPPTVPALAQPIRVYNQAVYVLPADLRGEKALDLLPHPEPE